MSVTVSPLYLGIVIALLSVGLSLQPQGSVARAQIPLLGGSPASQILIVSANLRECEPRDMQDLSELRVFARRLSNHAPFAPDALLLQEVKDRSARRVARLMERRYGMNYRVVSDTTVPFRSERDGKIIVRDTAIVLNTETMRPTQQRGYIPTSYDRSDAAAGTTPVVKRHAFVVAKERRSLLTVPLASVHFVRATVLRSREVADAYRRKWSVRVARQLGGSYPSTLADVTTVGGDFNSGRGLRTDGGKWRRMPFWTELTSDRDFNDTVYVAAKNLPFRTSELELSNVDYIFSRGGVADAASDLDYKSSGADRDARRFYSDHRFFWAVVGPKGLYFNQ